jgi:hypothetical protein
MKNIYKFLLVLFAFASLFSACTGDFNEINKNPNAISPDDASARYFLTKAEYKLYAPDRYPYWRNHLIHVDRYAGYFCFGQAGSWWNDGLGYTFHSSYTDAAWGMYGSYFGFINTYLKLTEVGGDFEDPEMYAIGLILKSLYYQQYTDVFGEVPYSEAGNPEISTPVFDEQKSIYQGIIADLDAAMAAIGDETATGTGVEDVGSNDVIFQGDLQKWKALANSLKLRVALRAYDAPGADFASGAITEAISAGIFLDVDALLKKDNAISQWNSSAYADIWHRFGGDGSKWKVTETMVDYLRDYNDPRLEKYADPIPGGEVSLTRPAEADNPEAYAKFPARIDFIKSKFDYAGVDYTYTEDGDVVTFNIPADTYYVGQPTRLNGDIKPLVKSEFFSSPDIYIIGEDADSDNVAPEHIMTLAEAYFLRAEAAVRGFGGDANQLFQDGIRAAMALHGVDGEDYIANAEIASLNGTTEENLEKIMVQRWINSYTDGFEGWAVVRKSGYPTKLAQGVSDVDIYSLGDIDGDYPTRMQYGPSAYSLNATNTEAAVARQGEDVQNTKLWWNK